MLIRTSMLYLGQVVLPVFFANWRSDACLVSPSLTKGMDGPPPSIDAPFVDPDDLPPSADDAFLPGVESPVKARPKMNFLGDIKKFKKDNLKESGSPSPSAASANASKDEPKIPSPGGFLAEIQNFKKKSANTPQSNGDKARAAKKTNDRPAPKKPLSMLEEIQNFKNRGKVSKAPVAKKTNDRPAPKKQLSMLEEIQNFKNRAKLKSTQSDASTHVAQKEPPKKPRTMMDDIQASLNNRRKAHRRDSEVEQEHLKITDWFTDTVLRVPTRFRAV